MLMRFSPLFFLSLFCVFLALTAGTVFSTERSSIYVEPITVVASLDLSLLRELCRSSTGGDTPQLEFAEGEYVHLMRNNPNHPKLKAHQKWVKMVMSGNTKYERCTGKTIKVDYFDLNSKTVQENYIGAGPKEIPGLKGIELANLMNDALLEAGLRTVSSSRANSEYLLRAVVSEMRYGKTGNSSDTTSLMMFGYFGGRRVEEFGSFVRLDVSLIDARTGRYLFTLPASAEATTEFVTETALGAPRSPEDDEDFEVQMIIAAMRKAIGDAAQLVRERVS